MIVVRASDLFLAAVHAVAPRALGVTVDAPELETGAQVLDWVARHDPAAAGILDALDERERADVRRVLDGMLRERGGLSPGPIPSS